MALGAGEGVGFHWMLYLLHLPLLPPQRWARSSLPASPQQRDPRIPKVTRCACESSPLQGHCPQPFPLLCRQRGPAGAAVPPTALLLPRRAPRAEKHPRKPMSNWGAALLSGEPPQPSQAALSTSRVCTPASLGSGCSPLRCTDERCMVLPHRLPAASQPEGTDTAGPFLLQAESWRQEWGGKEPFY